MISIKQGLALVSTVAALTTVPVVTQHHNDDSNEGPVYTTQEKEFYLTEEEKHLLRPGFQPIIESAEVNGNGNIEVVIAFYDDMDQPLDMEGIETPGEIGASFIFAWYDGPTRTYSAYTVRDQTSPDTGDTATQASTDRNGTWETIELGRYRYISGVELPADYDGSKTHTVACYADRDLEDIFDKVYEVNVVFDFRPDGGDLTEVWDAVDNATCNSCHHELALHGGHRKDVKLCVTCHNDGVIDPDTGNTVDMKVMIHKIHMGADLPSVQDGTPYQIVGYRQSVHDYSEVVLPRSILDCANCHRPDSPEGDIWMTRPTRAACGSCHDDVDFENAVNHPVPQFDDSECASCHAPQGEFEFDISVTGAHTIPAQSTQLAGLNTEIISVEDAFPGGMPTITFRITEDDGTFVDPSILDRMRFLIGGPTTDYAEYFQEDGFDATIVGDTAVKTLETALPEDAEGTWAFSADVYRWVIIDDGSDEGLEVREAALNPVVYADLTPAKALEPRRTVVTDEKCNVCHGQLAFHGGQRLIVDECLICHNPNVTDEEVRPDDEMPAESVHFKWLIHRIHTGHELTNDFTVYGHRGSVHNYNHVGYPGDRRLCEACHDEGTYSVPLPDGVLDTPTERDYYSPMKPAAAACLSCHSTLDAASHAYTNTAPFGESCGACHGDEREFSVEEVHAH